MSAVSPYNLLYEFFHLLLWSLRAKMFGLVLCSVFQNKVKAKNMIIAMWDTLGL